MGAISFSGLASGMDTSSWIEALVSIKKQSVTELQTKQTTIKSNKTVLDAVKSNVSALRTSIEKFTDSKLGGDFDLFSKNNVTTTNDKVVTASCTANAARQSLDVVVNQLATSTVATSSFNSLINGETKFSQLSSGNSKAGDFSIYVDGSKNIISVSEDATLNDILSQINDIEGISASISEGKFSLTSDDGVNVVVGSTTDESNFSSVLGLVRDSETGNYESHSSIPSLNSSDKIVDVFGDSAKGSFKIGNQEFVIDENTTFKSLIGSINAKSDSGVTASWDSANGSLSLKAKAEGAFNINVEAGTSNFTTLFGFTEGVKDSEGNYLKDSEGNYLSKIVQSSQVLGDYAKLIINGSEIVSSSNTVTSDISGIDGLILNLKSVNKKDENGDVEPTTISVSQDSEAVLNAVKSFVEAYNKAISVIDEKTKSGEALYGDTALVSLRNNLRRTATSSVDDTSLKLLSEIGITTGKVGNSTDTSKVNKLEIDEKKFMDVLNTNPEALKELLVGDNKGNSTSGGLMNKLETITEGSLEVSTGYFDAKNKSYDKQISSLSMSIERAESKVESYKARLEKQFKNMENMVASIQSSYSKLSI